MKKRLSLLLLLAVASMSLKAQNVAIRTNIIGDGLLSPNLALEVGVAPKWTVALSDEVNYWTINDHRWKHWVVSPAARYWFCDRFMGHFVGIHALGGKYNFGNIKNGISFLGSDLYKLTDYRYQGWAVGGGVSYGYAWILGRHWNLELELGVGYIYTRYDKYNCAACGRKLEEDVPHHYVGPTKAALNLVYVF